jgi:REP element-mobilizing transposase RayT
MPFDPSRHHRRSIRLCDWDYTANGAYFITLVTHDRASLFGDIVDGVMRLNAYGEIARACWEEIPSHFDHVEIDAFVIMPNHVHGIVLIVNDKPASERAVGLVGAQHCCAPTTNNPKRHEINVNPGSLGAIIRSYKSAVAKEINQSRGTPAEPVWQRNYYERIIRNEREFNAFREYIINNPARWAEDAENR